MPRKGYNCYKVVKEKDGRLYSCRVGFNNYDIQVQSLCVEYGIGMRTVAPIGYLYTFSNLDAAKRFAQDYDDEPGVSYKVFKAMGYGKKSKIHCMWIDMSYGSFLKLWEGKTYEWSRANAPKGSVGYKEVELIEEVK